MTSVEAPDARTVVMRFSEKASIELPLTAAALPIFSRAFFAERDFEASILEPVLGCGPYKVGNFSVGRFIEYERVPDYWAADLPIARGFNNFDVIRVEFYRERQAAFEAFKKGEITFQQEATARIWATEYNFPAVQDGRVIKTTFPQEDRPKLQAWFFNTRRRKFFDSRTRQAIGLAFDYEWVNQNLFYNSYVRASSPFEGSPFQATGKPSRGGARAARAVARPTSRRRRSARPFRRQNPTVPGRTARSCARPRGCSRRPAGSVKATAFAMRTATSFRWSS